MKRGMLLFAHGARDPRWALPFEDTARRLRAQAPEVEVLLCYLDLMQPDLASAAETLVRGGCERIDVLPMFLGTGGHVRNDLPVLLDRLAERHPAVQWRLGTPVGEIDSVIDAMARAAAGMAREV